MPLQESKGLLKLLLRTCCYGATHTHTLMLLFFVGIALVRALPPPRCNITTVAGTPFVPGNSSGSARAAELNNPVGIAVSDASGAVILADNLETTGGGSQLREYTPPPLSLLRTFAGSGARLPFADGPALSATLWRPRGLCWAPPAGGGAPVLHVMDAQFRRVRVVTPAGLLETRSGNGSAGTVEDLWRSPSGCAWDAANAQLLVMDGNAHVVRALVGALPPVNIAGTLSTPGFQNGVGSAARFNFPFAVAVEPATAAPNAYIADLNNGCVRWMTLVESGGVPRYSVGLLAGRVPADGVPLFVDGVGSAAAFYHPSAVAFDPFGGLLVADALNHAVRYVDVATATVTTLLGNASPDWSDGEGWPHTDNADSGVARLWLPSGLALLRKEDQPSRASGAFSFYVADTLNNVLRLVTCRYDVLPEPVTPNGSGGLESGAVAGIVLALAAAGAFAGALVHIKRRDARNKKSRQDLLSDSNEEPYTAPPLTVSSRDSGGGGDGGGGGGAQTEKIVLDGLFGPSPAGPLGGGGDGGGDGWEKLVVDGGGDGLEKLVLSGDSFPASASGAVGVEGVEKLEYPVLLAGASPPAPPSVDGSGGRDVYEKLVLSGELPAASSDGCSRGAAGETLNQPLGATAQDAKALPPFNAGEAGGAASRSVESEVAMVNPLHATRLRALDAGDGGSALASRNSGAEGGGGALHARSVPSTTKAGAAATVATHSASIETVSPLILARVQRRT